MRACLNEIIVRKEDAIIDMVLALAGRRSHRAETSAEAECRRSTSHPIPKDMISFVRELARLMPDRQIARLLNRSGKSMALGKAWTEQRVKGFRKHHDIEVYRDGEWAERGEITLEAAAQIIGVHKMTALRMIRRGNIKGRQFCKGAPWVIKATDVARFKGQQQSRGPVTSNPAQQVLDFQ